MVLVLGVSAGAGGARAILTHSDQPHLSPIDQCRATRRHGGTIDEPVFAAIRQMRGAAARRGELITATAVSCRCRDHAEAIRGAKHTEKRATAEAGGELLTVDEPLAQLRYLRFTGQLPRAGSVIFYDLGSSGLTIAHADCRTDTILAVRHSTVLGGDGYDTLLRRRLATHGVVADAPTTRRHREELSSTRVVTALDTTSGSRAVLTRSDLAALCATGLQHSVSLVRQLIDESGTRPQAVVLLGGCVRNPALRAELSDRIGLPIIYDRNPENVSARGAVLLATQRRSNRSALRSAAGPADDAVPETGKLPESLVTCVVGRRKLVAAIAVTGTLAATVAGLLVAQHDSVEPTQRVSVPTQLVGTAPTP